jgi:dCMP deaminase
VTKGYNSSLVGMASCDKEGHYLVDGHCIRTLHAEQMAIASAVKKGISLNGTHAYLTHTPCVTCAKLLVAAGVKSITYSKEYSNVLSREYLDLISIETNVKIEQYKEEENV